MESIVLADDVYVNHDTLQVEAYGEKFAFELLKFFATGLVGAKIEIVKREDGVTTFRRLN